MERRCSLVSRASIKALEENGKPKGSLLPEGMSKCKAILLVTSLVIAYICWGCAMSLQAPLFPTEAEKKGASASEVSMQNNANICWEPSHTPLITSSIYPGVLQHFTLTHFLKKLNLHPTLYFNSCQNSVIITFMHFF